MNRPGLREVGLCLLTLVSCGAVVAAAEPEVAEARAGGARTIGSAIEWDLGEAASATVTLSHPDGTVTRHEFAPGEQPRIDAIGGAQALADGQYVYEIIGAPDLGAPTMNHAGFVHSGTFEIRDGEFFLKLAAEPTAGGAEPQPNPVQTLPHNTRVEASVCIGLSCANPLPSYYSFDRNERLRIQGAGLIEFDSDDTSTRTWEIQALRDLWFSRTTGPLQRSIVASLNGSAPANSLVIDNTGRLGLGTATPFKNLHINTPGTPGIRLGANASTGGTAHVWDIGASSVAFTVGDEGRFPFQVRAAAPTSSLAIAANGFVGLGTDFPAAKLHIVGAGNMRALFDDNTRAEAWSIGTAGQNFAFDETNNPGVELLIDQLGNAVLRETMVVGRDVSVARDGNFGRNVSVVGDLTVGGQILSPSSRDLKGDFAAVDPQAILERVVAMPVSTWSYNDAAGVRHLGPMAEDFHASFGLGSTDKAIATVDSDGVALAAIQGLHRKLEDENAELRRRIELLEAVVRRLAPAPELP